MSVTQDQVEAKDFIGSKVSTPDGGGVVLAADVRYVSVKLETGPMVHYGYRDVTLLSKIGGSQDSQTPLDPESAGGQEAVVESAPDSTGDAEAVPS